VRDTDHPDGDIEIQYTGLRPGEKLYEELLIGSNVTGTEHPMIMRAIESCPTWDEARALLEELTIAVSRFDCKHVLKLLERGVKEYSRAAEIHDLVWRQRPAVEAAVEAGDPKVTVLAEHRAQKTPG
jgi:FlaA1/EpsC-like NDP-sugar epimerase